MGFLDALKRLFGLGGRKSSVILVGLDNSGKSTIISKLKKENGSSGIAPTVGYATDTIRVGPLEFSCFDMSGQERYRTLWEQCYENAEAIVFVIDSDDRCRMCVVKDELSVMLSSPNVKSRSLPILFFANKMDLPSAMGAVECTSALGLQTIEDKPWHITSSNALTGEGIEEGMNWLVDQILRMQRRDDAK